MPRLQISILVVALLFAQMCCAEVLANDQTQAEFFESRIRPVLVKSCYECHSTSSDEVGGELLLDSRNALRKGGESGPAIEVGSAEASLLVKAIKYEDLEMPPSGKLPDHVIADFEKWINTGCLLYTSPSPRDQRGSRMPSSA